MRVVVTGSRGRIGGATVSALAGLGHDVVGTDLTAPDHSERSDAHEYLQVDLTDSGQAFAVVHGAGAVVHAAAIPDGAHHPPHLVMANNVMAGFNIIQAAAQLGVHRLVNISSVTVVQAELLDERYAPARLPLDESEAVGPRDVYGFSKAVVEGWCDAVCATSDLTAVSLRPSWVLSSTTYEESLASIVGTAFVPRFGFWSYTDLDDLTDAIALALGVDIEESHEAVFVAQPDNLTGLDLETLVHHSLPNSTVELAALKRPDASGIDSGKAEALLGWRPTRSWRHHIRD